MHYLQSKFIFILFSSLLLILSGCAELDSHSSISRFVKAENVYRASIRWEEWEGLSQLMRSNPETSDSKMKPISEEQREHLESIKVAHVEVLSSGIIEEDKSGESLFEIEYRFDNSAVIKKFKHKVKWWFDKENNSWYTDTPLPKEFAKPKSRTIKLSPHSH